MANFRQGIITALKTQMGNISIVNGYETNLGANIHEWRVTPFSTADLPAIDIQDGFSAAEDMNNTLSNKELSVNIIAYDAPDSTTLATIGRSYIRDILKAVSTDLNMGNNAYQIDETGATIEIEQNGDATLAVTVNIVVHYQTEKWSD